jgi:uncharacterized membrane protein
LILQNPGNPRYFYQCANARAHNLIDKCNYTEMRKFSTILILFGLFFACKNGGPASSSSTPDMASLPVQTVRGMYKMDSNGAFFYDCSADETYRVGDRPANLDSMYREIRLPTTYPGEPVFAVLQGKIAKPEKGEGTLAIIQVDTLSPRTMLNSCQAFDFWCMGTEPFWGLVISEAEGTLALKIVAEAEGKVFPWVAPKQVEDALVYESTDRGSGEKIKVLVRKSPCSDGMSDRMFSHSVEVQIGPQILLGCAVE